MSASTKVTYTSAAGSVYIDALTKQVLDVMNILVALPKFGGETEPMTATQGSWRPYTSYSGSTHTGCAAIDLTAYNWRNRLIVGDLCGIDVFHRLTTEGDWPEHDHCATRGMGCAARALQGQNASVKAGRNGLRDNAADRDAHLRSHLWSLAVFQGRRGVLTPTRPTRLYDGPAYSRAILKRGRLPGMKVNAIMEVNVDGERWFVTDQGEWGFSAKWRLA